MATSIESINEPPIQNDTDKEKNPGRNDDAGTLLSGDSIESNEAAQISTDAETLKDSIHLSEMESSLESNNFPVDDIPEPIKVLDDIISEFEETSKPIIVANAENQSEDDGYMSLSRKNMRKTDSEEASLASLNRASVETPPNQEAAIQANGVATSDIDDSTKNQSLMAPAEVNLVQTTLPKARTTSTNASQSNYSSLPCCGGRSSSFAIGDMGQKQHRIGSCNGDRNVLGIDISAVHKAVLRGGAPKLPEPILNEHPVTIYPGRYSPPNGDGSRISGLLTRPLRLQSSVDKHKEVCHILKPQSSKSSSSSSSPRSTSGSLASKSQESNADIAINKKFSSSKKKSTKSELLTNYIESDDGGDADDGEGDDFSEDSVDGEQSSLSMSAELLEKPMTSRKQASIAWEINFNNERRRTKPQTSTKSGSRKHQKKIATSAAIARPQQQTFGIAYSNAIYSLDPEEEFANNVYAVQDLRKYNEHLDYYEQHGNMLGKGTFVIRRGTADKQLPRAADVFQVSSFSHTGDMHSASLSPSTPPPYRENHRKDDQKTKCCNSKHNSMDRCHGHRSSLPSPRERLSLNIEGHSMQQNVLKKEEVHISSCSVKKPPMEEFTKFAKSSSKDIDRQKNIELIKENENCTVGDYEGINGFTSSYRCPNGSNKNVDHLSTSASTTPHTDLAPTIEEEEEQYSDLSYSGAASAPPAAPRLKQIESNISALLRGEIAVARAGEVVPPIRSLEFRPGVHKSESAKEMKLSQNTIFGPLPPSPPPPPTDSSSKPSLYDYDALPLPPLPASPEAVSTEGDDDDELHLRKGSLLLRTTSVEVHKPNNAEPEERICLSRDRSADRRERGDRERKRGTVRQMSDDLPLPPTISSFEHMPPAVPPHRGHSANTMKSWSIDSNYRRRSPKVIGGSMGGYGGCGTGGGSGMTKPTGTHQGLASNEVLGMGTASGGCGVYSTKRYYGNKRGCRQSPRDEHRGSLQTSCSLPETPIFARGCDIPRTPFRRNNENNPLPHSGSRTAPRSTSHNVNIGASVVGIGGAGGVSSMCRNRSISHALASNEMLRMSGLPARGWYPKQRSMRPASTENIDRLSSMRVWDCAATNIGSNGNSTSSRKPLTLPPNLTPSFLNKSPREALRRVTSLLITKKKNTKERRSGPYYEDTIDGPATYEVGSYKTTKDPKHDKNCNSSVLPKTPKPPKKKGLFKNLWKRTKHVSLDQ